MTEKVDKQVFSKLFVREIVDRFARLYESFKSRHGNSFDDDVNEFSRALSRYLNVDIYTIKGVGRNFDNREIIKRELMKDERAFKNLVIVYSMFVAVGNCLNSDAYDDYCSKEKVTQIKELRSKILNAATEKVKAVSYKAADEISEIDKRISYLTSFVEVLEKDDEYIFKAEEEAMLANKSDVLNDCKTINEIASKVIENDEGYYALTDEDVAFLKLLSDDGRKKRYVDWHLVDGSLVSDLYYLVKMKETEPYDLEVRAKEIETVLSNLKNSCVVDPVTEIFAE